jgi:hypothetical protein
MLPVLGRSLRCEELVVFLPVIFFFFFLKEARAYPQAQAVALSQLGFHSQQVAAPQPTLIEVPSAQPERAPMPVNTMDRPPQKISGELNLVSLFS